MIVWVDNKQFTLTTTDLENGDSIQVRYDRDKNIFWKISRAKTKKERTDKWLLFSGLMGWGFFLLHVLGDYLNG